MLKNVGFFWCLLNHTWRFNSLQNNNQTSFITMELFVFNLAHLFRQLSLGGGLWSTKVTPTQIGLSEQPIHFFLFFSPHAARALARFALGYWVWRRCSEIFFFFFVFSPDQFYNRKTRPYHCSRQLVLRRRCAEWPALKKKKKRKQI